MTDNKKLKIIDESFYAKTIVFLISVVLFIFLFIPTKNQGSTGLSDDSFLTLYESSWLFFSQLFSTLLSILILKRLFKEVKKSTGTESSIVSNLSFYGGFSMVVFSVAFAIYFFAARYLDSTFILPVEIFYVYTFLIIVFFGALDYYAYHAGIFKNLKEENAKFIKQYNLIILIGFFIILIVGKVTENVYNHTMSVGFAGGSIAFQLLVAHWLFDINNYNIFKHENN